MTVFVDTSALLAVLNAADPAHDAARQVWDDLLTGDGDLRTHSYVVLESSALLQRRHGLDAVRALHHEVLPVLTVRFVDSHLHGRAVAALLAAGRRAVSLVHHTSFELMRDEGIQDAFALDEDFDHEGFGRLPAPV